MLNETLAALKALKASKALGLTKEKLDLIANDIRNLSNSELWSALTPTKKKAAAPKDLTLEAVKAVLKKYKAPAATKALQLASYLLPDRDGPPPNSLPKAMKLMRVYLTDEEITRGAAEFMAKTLKESGTDVPL